MQPPSQVPPFPPPTHPATGSDRQPAKPPLRPAAPGEQAALTNLIALTGRAELVARRLAVFALAVFGQAVSRAFPPFPFARLLFVRSRVWASWARAMQQPFERQQEQVGLQSTGLLSTGQPRVARRAPVAAAGRRRPAPRIRDVDAAPASTHRLLSLPRRLCPFAPSSFSIIPSVRLASHPRPDASSPETTIAPGPGPRETASHDGPCEGPMSSRFHATTR